MTMKRIRLKKPWIGYPGPPVQGSYAESVDRGYFLWDITSRTDFDVSFEKLANNKPFINVDWQSTVEDTLLLCLKHPHGSRFKIKSDVHISQRDIHALISTLKQQRSATEVTFKIDQYVKHDMVTSGLIELQKNDLRNPEVLFQLLKTYCSSIGVDDVVDELYEQIRSYLAIVSQGEELTRNVKWSINRLEFDNMFGFGEDNIIDFRKMSGIVGIFGPNRVGKSSIIGTILYALFNATDRGTIKNQFICNERKEYCLSKAVVSANGVDYVIERQTLKHESKKGSVSANTALNVFRYVDDKLVDMCGEQRRDTEKIVQAIVGTADDFLLTTAATQGEMTQYIKQNATPRRKILTRFLDLDVFDKLYDLANRDANTVKAQLRNYPDRDWSALQNTREVDIEFFTSTINDLSNKISDANIALTDLRHQFASHSGTKPVSSFDVEQQKKSVVFLTNELSTLTNSIVENQKDIVKIEEKILTITSLKQEHDLEELKKRRDALISLETSISTLQHAYDKKQSVLKQQQKSLTLLSEVPCGDSFPTCKFIKDAHNDKTKIDEQKTLVEDARERVASAQSALETLKEEDVKAKITKLEKLHDLYSRLELDVTKKKSALTTAEGKKSTIIEKLNAGQQKLVELEAALGTEENIEIVSLRTEIDVLSKNIKEWDDEKLRLASQKGHALSTIEKLKEEQLARNELLQKMKTFDLIAYAFSRKGVPSDIIKSQLPMINSEIVKILHGIVDFTVELETDPLSDSTELYINYGDTKRIIELGSGMEKMISSIALRTALTNVSSLPKTDMLIIDEGFDALDAEGRESCNRLLVSLKKYFRLIIIISHLDTIKDVADEVLEITKDDKDARIVYE